MLSLPCCHTALCTCLRTISLHFFLYDLERLSFLGWPYRVSAFGALHRIQASNKHSVVYATFDIQPFWCGVTCVSKNCASQHVMGLVTSETSFTMRGATVVQPHQYIIVKNDSHDRFSSHMNLQREATGYPPTSFYPVDPEVPRL